MTALDRQKADEEIAAATPAELSLDRASAIAISTLVPRKEDG
jgi:hypothetical protein